MNDALFTEELEAKFYEVQAELNMLKDVLRQHVLILEDLHKLTGVSIETLANNHMDTFGTEKIECTSCGKMVAAKRQICPHCMYFVHESDYEVEHSRFEIIKAPGPLEVIH